MAISIGDVCYMDYGEIPACVHTRVVLAEVDAASQEFIILTPDFDIYCEQLDAANPDLTAFYNVGPGGALPAGVPPASIYGFAPMQAQELARHMAAGRREAQSERLRRGLVGAALPAAPAAVGGHIWVLGEMVEGHRIGEVVQPPVGHPVLEGYGLMNMTDAGGKTRPVLIRRLLPEEVAAFCEERVKLARSSEASEGEDLFAAEDVRTMPITYNANGERSKSFKEAIGEMVQCSFEDFPLEPRTTLEYLRAVGTISESCYAQHLAWVQQARIPDNNRATHEDELLARVLDMCISYDCLNPANLACMELVVRRRQLIAQAHALNPASPSYDGADLFLGNQYRAGGGIVVPTLKEHVSKGLQAESQILKERRKLAEARGRGGGPPKGDGKGRGAGAASS